MSRNHHAGIWVAFFHDNAGIWLPTISLRTGAGTCYYRCVLSAMKYLLKRRGVPKAAIKQLTFVIRQKYVEVRNLP